MVTVGGTAGTSYDVAETVRHLAGSARTHQLADDEEHRLLAALRDFPGVATAKISTLPSDTLGSLPLPDSAVWLAYPTVGLTYLRLANWSATEMKMLRAAVRQRGGHAVLWHASPQMKSEAGVWGTLGPELQLMRKVKDVFDPRDIMSPGRFVV
jgi:FAD/FMN-containing dehydrogenase